MTRLIKSILMLPLWCFGGGGGMAAPAPVPAPAPIPQTSDPQVQKAGEDDRRRRRAAASSTLLTGAQGVVNPAASAPKTLLGS
jgi:hypothetical protein